MNHCNQRIALFLRVCNKYFIKLDSEAIYYFVVISEAKVKYLTDEILYNMRGYINCRKLNMLSFGRGMRKNL